MSTLETEFAGELDVAGVKYTKRANKLFGRPDFVLDGDTCVVFIHGCYWHGHSCKNWNLSPIWTSKINSTKLRDFKVRTYYKHSKYKYFRIWECELQKYGARAVVQKLQQFISSC